jgi:hypothetical protein
LSLDAALRPLPCKRAAERTRGLRAHLLPRDPLERRLEDSSPQATFSGPERRARRIGRDGRADARASGTLMGGSGGRRETARNATPAADYRTALLSDSP